MFRSLLAPREAPSPSETIDTLCDRVLNSTLINVRKKEEKLRKRKKASPSVATPPSHEGEIGVEPFRESWHS